MNAPTMAVRTTPGSPTRLEAQQRPEPGDPGPGELRIRLHATSLNYHDLLVANGAIPTADNRIPMADGAGVVEAIGPGVTGFATGDHVISCFFPDWQDGPPRIGDFAGTPGDGIDGYARPVAVCPATAFTRAPQSWTHAEAATLTTAGLTAWRALMVDGALRPGATVLALGTGGVAIYALQLARLAGARVAITSSSDDKLARAKALGAECTINYRTNPDWAAAVMDWTHGAGVDHVIELGGPGTLPQSIASVAIGGHIALIGVLTGFAGAIPTAQLMARQARLQGLIVGSRAQQQDMVRALDASDLRPVIDREYPLAELADAFAAQQAAGHFGKLCATW